MQLADPICSQQYWLGAEKQKEFNLVQCLTLKNILVSQHKEIRSFVHHFYFQQHIFLVNKSQSEINYLFWWISIQSSWFKDQQKKTWLAFCNFVEKILCFKSFFTVLFVCTFVYFHVFVCGLCISEVNLLPTSVCHSMFALTVVSEGKAALSTSLPMFFNWSDTLRNTHTHTHTCMQETRVTYTCTHIRRHT